MKKSDIKKPFDKAVKLLEQYTDKAGDIVRHNGSLKVLISRARKWVKKASAIPGMDALLEDVADMLDLLADYANGSYRQAPTRIVVAAAASLLYILSPVNILPNFLPVVGVLDDIAIVYAVMDLGLASELKKYKDWRLQKLAGLQKDTAEAVDVEEN